MTETPTGYQSLLATLITSGVALTGILITTLLTWIKDLNDLSRRVREIEYLTKRVDLWQKLFNLQKELTSRESENTLFVAFVRSELKEITKFFEKRYDLAFERRHFARVNRFRMAAVI